jgi:hypothetical protein
MVGLAATKIFERGIMKLPERWRRCIEVQGEYVEKHATLLEKKM